MSITIYDKILKKGEDEVNRILSEAKAEAKRITDDIVNRALKAQEDRLEKANSDANRQLNHQEKLLELEKRQALLNAKQAVIQKIFDEVLVKLNNLEGQALLKFVTKLIEEETINGNESIFVNSKDYDKYLKALSTNSKGKLVDLDLLNNNLKTNLKLSSEPINIENGFLIEGKDYDLNFSLTDLVRNLRTKYEKEIAEELFS